MSTYQYYEFLALDRPLTVAEQAEVRQISSRARITATSFTNEYHWGDLRGNPDVMMERYYDASLYLANWGTHRIMLRLPRTLLDPAIVEQYCVDELVSLVTTPDYVILDLTSEDEAGDWVEDAEDSLSAIVGIRSELVTGDLRSLYLGWLSACSAWVGDEGDEDDEDVLDDDALEPPVPAGLGALTASQRALADFLRVDSDLLEAAAQASPPLPEAQADAGLLAEYVAKLPVCDKDRLLVLVGENQAARARMELLRGLRGEPDELLCSRPRRTVAGLLGVAAACRARREEAAAELAAAQRALREQQRAAALQRRLDQLAKDPEAAWAEVGNLISTKQPARYDDAVALLTDLRELAQRDGQVQVFAQRLAAVREAHLRKPSLIDRLNRAGLTA